MNNLLTFIGGIFLLPLLAILRAYTISTLWRWFIVSHFHVATLPLVISYGIALLVNQVVFDAAIYAKEDAKWTMGSKVGLSISSMLVALLLGWLAHLLV